MISKKRFLDIFDALPESKQGEVIDFAAYLFDKEKKNAEMWENEDDPSWTDEKETRYLESIPGMNEKLLRGRREPLSDGVSWKELRKGV